MKKYPANPVRLIDRPMGQAATHAGLLIRSAIAAPAEDTPRVKWRIRNTLRSRVERRSRLLRLALVGVLVFLVGGVVGAAVEPWLRKNTLDVTSPKDEPALAAGSKSRAQAFLRGSPMFSPMESSPEPTLDEAKAAHAENAEASPSTVAARPRMLGRHGHSQSPAVTPAPPPAQIPEAPEPLPAPPSVALGISPDEQALIANALEKLRTSRQPEAALAALDAYRARFPTGALLPEERRLRTEALLALGHKGVVLDELDHATVSDSWTADERLVLRGELRAAAGRWQGALADFQAVLGAHPSCDSDSIDQRTEERIERALWGRASARSHGGDEAGAIADLRAYLRCFPEGRFAERARLLLKGRR